MSRRCNNTLKILDIVGHTWSRVSGQADEAIEVVGGDPPLVAELDCDQIICCNPTANRFGAHPAIVRDVWDGEERSQLCATGFRHDEWPSEEGMECGGGTSLSGAAFATS